MLHIQNDLTNRTLQIKDHYAGCIHNTIITYRCHCSAFDLIKKLGRISPDEGKCLKILKIETRHYDNCNCIYLNYSTVYNFIVFGVIYHILYDMNFKDTMNCINSNDRLIDSVLKWEKYSAVFYVKGS